jgi:hypothetical protein
VRAAEAAGAEPVHAIVAVDSEACLVDIEAAWPGGRMDYRLLTRDLYLRSPT